MKHNPTQNCTFRGDCCYAGTLPPAVIPPPPPPPANLPYVVNTHKALPAVCTGGGADWLEIAQYTDNGKTYSLLVRMTPSHFPAPFGADNNYLNSGNDAPFWMEAYWNSIAGTGSILAQYAVTNDAIAKLGKLGNVYSTDGLSVPTGTRAAASDKNVMFLLSADEFHYFFSSGNSPEAQDNWDYAAGIAGGISRWSRTAYDAQNGSQVSAVDGSGALTSFPSSSSSAGWSACIWVDSDIFAACP